MVVALQPFLHEFWLQVRIFIEYHHYCPLKNPNRSLKLLKYS